MKSSVIILSAKSYDFKNSDGSAVAGCKVQYLMTDSLKPVQNAGENTLGYIVGENTVDLNYYMTLQQVGLPCQAVGNFEMRNSKGVIKIVLTSIDEKSVTHFN